MKRPENTPRIHHASAVFRPGLRLGPVVLALALVVPAAPVFAETPPVLLILRPTAAVDSGFVPLSEVVEVSADSRGFAGYLSSLWLGRSPAAGDIRRIGREELVEHLRSCGISADMVRVEGAEQIVLYRRREGESESPGPDSAQRLAAKRTPGDGRLAAGPSSAQPPRRADGVSAVESGARLILRADLGPVTIEDDARALESGGRGDLVEVENLRTGRHVLARVIRPGVAVPETYLEGEGQSRGPRVSSSAGDARRAGMRR